MVAIPLTDINGKLKITIYHKYSSGKASFKIGLKTGTTTVTPSEYSTNQQTPKDAANADTDCSYTYGSDVIGAATTAVLFVGEAGTSYTQIKSVLIETLEVECDATAPGNINKGELTAGSITLTVTGSPESGDAWYWQSAANGELKTDEYDAVNGKTVSVAGTYYIRSYNASGDCWSAAKSITLTANDFKEHYAVTYNKGAYGTGSIEAGEKIQGEDFTLSSSRFTRDGYVQVGWATTDGGEKAYNLGDTYTTDAAITLYPVWLAAESYSFSYTGAKTISELEAAGWTFNSAIFDADPTDGEAYVNLVSAMNTAGLSTPKTDGSMEDNAIAFTKTTDAVATYDIGKTVKVVALNATLYGGSGKGFDQVIKYVGSDNSTVKKTYTNNLNAGNWKANNINKEEAVEDVRYIKIYGASKWVVMYAFSIAYVSKYTINFAAGDGDGTMDPIQYYAGNDVELPASTFTAPANKVFDAWTSSDVTITDGGFTMPAKNVTVTATYTNATSLDNTADETNAIKRIENGMLVIEKNGVRYNAQGQVIR